MLYILFTFIFEITCYHNKFQFSLPQDLYILFGDFEIEINQRVNQEFYFQLYVFNIAHIINLNGMIRSNKYHVISY